MKENNMNVIVAVVKEGLEWEASVETDVGVFLFPFTRLTSKLGKSVILPGPELGDHFGDNNDVMGKIVKCVRDWISEDENNGS
jgi:hypothetical protein